MTTTSRLCAALAAAAIAITIGGPAFGQADNTNSVIAPASPPSALPRYGYYDAPRYQYDYSSRYQYDTSRQAYIDEAARQWDASHGYREVPPAYVIEQPYIEPYPRYRSRLRVGDPGLVAGEDSNPNDYATGIYNPKP